MCVHPVLSLYFTCARIALKGRLVTCVWCCWLLLMGVDVKSVSVHTSAVPIVFILYCPCISRVHGLL